MARCVAGAASRLGPVSVLAPGPPGTCTADGLFDVEGIGEGPGLEWRGTGTPSPFVVVENLTEPVTELLAGAGIDSGYYLEPSGVVADPRWRQLAVVAPPGDRLVQQISPYVPVNRTAEGQRHHGFGFTDYLLVLSKAGEPDEGLPAPAAWLTAAFHHMHVVTLAGGVASAWRGRSLRGRITIDTRMDLWRLIAHAAVCIDLGPGTVLARECVESLRLGTPVLTPEAEGVAATHARASGGAAFGDPGELIEAVDALRGEQLLAVVSASGRRYADDRFGNPTRLVTEIATLRAAR